MANATSHSTVRADIRECLDRAAYCSAQAATQTDLELRRLFLDTAERWLKLALSFERTAELLGAIETIR